MRYVRYFQSTSLYLILVCVISSSNAIVLHPDSGQPTEKPADAVIGRWDSNASFVVIAPNAIITTRHQKTTPSSVEINNTNYSLGEIYTTTDNSDIQIAELVGANLANYVPVYTASDEENKQIILGGYGRGRDPDKDTLTGFQGKEYGYEWGSDNNETLLWGTNTIDEIGELNGHKQLVTDFDGPDVSRQYEASIADYDSGSGWFMKNDSGEWYLAGLSYATTLHYDDDGNRLYQSWFDSSGPGPSTQDLNYAHRLSDHGDWIDDTLETIAIPEPATVLIFTLGGWFALRRRTI
ncbi:hypothetical protein SMSP2_00773 [Limihaloglobus sulfuriphilus]|uniref:PEP-CTERM protein-sorting domain-containing protein n=1 Tax=Limihaloglobus sulfuriphilus TaxID=1851148 RepID=A0A1Q2MCK6_9BACT|nr:PEP-CTERM sorting domain-containing protein [Limihaloglobus sulfuriphilus]AQQ70425.1 hypothetical protein SMSP2_00773 [Limihaloglobus sulfuriphilus]